jgi:AraC-like DNA-binding protein
MRMPASAPLPLDAPPPLWPPLLATRGPGAASDGHAHHAMHVVLALAGRLRVRVGEGPWRPAAGVVTPPDVAHAIDGSGVEVLLVFLDPESQAGAALRERLAGEVRLLTRAQADALAAHGDARALMAAADGVAFTRVAVALLGGEAAAQAGARRVHPRVRKLLRLLRERPADDDASLVALAAAVGLSPGRLMHTFTESLGIPLRPYLLWLKLQRAAAAIAGGAGLAEAAVAAGFADAAHMSRTFRRMLGMPPSALRAQIAAAGG